jgi:hypothetical protein
MQTPQFTVCKLSLRPRLCLEKLSENAFIQTFGLNPINVASPHHDKSTFTNYEGWGLRYGNYFFPQI